MKSVQICAIASVYRVFLCASGLTCYFSLIIYFHPNSVSLQVKLEISCGR